MKKFNSFLFLSVLLILTSCGGEAPKAEVLDEPAKSVEVNTETEEAPEFFLPSALQIGSLFQRSGLTFVEGITLDPSKSSSFSTKTEKLMALGIYSADLSYSVLNNQSQQSISTLNAVKQLSEESGLAEVFSSADLLTNFEKNLGNQDSILNIIIEIQERTDNYIDENGLKSLATTVFTGAWTEGMYIGVKATAGEDRSKITGRLVEQMTILDNLITAMQFYHKHDGATVEVIEKLKDIRDYFNGIEAIENRDGGSVKNIQINFSEIKTIADKIVELRAMITKS